jgi:hypothetical protein
MVKNDKKSGLNVPASLSVSTASGSTVSIKTNGKLKGAEVSAVVSDGSDLKVKALANGKYSVTASKPGVSYIIWTAVKNDIKVQSLTRVIASKRLTAEDITISGEGVAKTDKAYTLELKPGQLIHLTASIPADCTETAPLKWKSRNSAVKVTDDGYAAALKSSKKGDLIARIGNVTVKVKVTVADSDIYMSLKKPVIIVKAGKTVKVPVKVSDRKVLKTDTISAVVTDSEGKEVGTVTYNCAKHKLSIGKDTAHGTYYLRLTSSAADDVHAEGVIIVK